MVLKLNLADIKEYVDPFLTLVPEPNGRVPKEN